MKKKFVCYFFFVGWWAFSIGFHISVKEPNIEIHLPFGFIRVGWALDYSEYITDEESGIKKFGLK